MSLRVPPSHPALSYREARPCSRLCLTTPDPAPSASPGASSAAPNRAPCSLTRSHIRSCDLRGGLLCLRRLRRGWLHTALPALFWRREYLLLLYCLPKVP
ncbi:hypothetical protein M430DRAFT_204883 [Amorphotheca resinae ATCC 22711]|uniref:Uncharacterized protein n=1 Tax=Amorphotheca resinae ATCC 22711 TaxID=857342 RepID=A0A2T3BBD7_AMORE|nr:hypothetical protein M430DRAFT_204883 [Amorphotheca resinae ATCC 22711]PSS25647.1 hypothetical protein M430DRAFT_204883 [Amorphotheca resinae ATCC 22711]